MFIREDVILESLALIRGMQPAMLGYIRDRIQ